MKQLKNYKALLFDLNGTMIDDMGYHIKAWHRILNELGANLSMERVKEECYGKNHELLERVFPGRFSQEEKDKLSIEKETQYQAEFRPHLQLIDGLDTILEKASAAGIKMTIGSAAIMFNIAFVIDGLNIRHYFDALVSADDVKKSKPDPETWILCAERLKVSPSDCLVFEDAPKGVESAANAGMDTVVITTMHEPHEFSQYKNVIGFIKNYNDSLVRSLKTTAVHSLKLRTTN
jgi:beta-phosphoglucomutase family hydrolase